MRLTQEEAEAIGRTARAVFGPDVEVRLFGSRTDDRLRGGDIDLHLRRAGGRPSAAIAGCFRDRLHEQIGERAIDLVFHDPADPHRAIDRAAMRDGIVL